MHQAAGRGQNTEPGQGNWILAGVKVFAPNAEIKLESSQIDSHFPLCINGAYFAILRCEFCVSNVALRTRINHCQRRLCGTI